MGQNDKTSDVELNVDTQLIGLAPPEVSSPSTNMDGRAALPHEPHEEDDGNLGRAGEVTMSGEIARDMSLLSRLVMWRRNAKSVNADDQDQTPQPEASIDRAALDFVPIGISLQGDEQVRIVNSVAQAIECLTTEWPVRYGDAFEEALQACIDSVKGKTSPEQVRVALVNAAKAAGMRVTP
ncbi:MULTISPECIES: DUF982 domain-containing protein [unclassified Rhizobium]|uniref:DUF982 domain-containing protein n=1 Tax=unclassified Rhizobium TaxID=2613769 RepID=UPI001FDEAD68|nr:MULTISPECIES: DUF982 domain-containing protein [unclassified Rhizobium]